MSASIDIANFQMGATFLVWEVRLFKPGCSLNFFNCEEGHSFEVSVHLGRGDLSYNYGIFNLSYMKLSFRINGKLKKLIERNNKAWNN